MGYRGDGGGAGSFRGGARGGRGGAHGGRGTEQGRHWGWVISGRCEARLISCRNGAFPQPNPNITKTEDAQRGDISTALSNVALHDRLPARPGYGTRGLKHVVLWTNYFQLEAKPGLELYRYSVGFQGAENLPKPKKKRLIRLLLQQPAFEGLTVASDWSQTLVSAAKVHLLEAVGRETFKIEWYLEEGRPLPGATDDENQKLKEVRKKNTYILTVQDIGSVSVAALLEDLSHGSTYYPLRIETIQALNIVMAHGPSTDYLMAANTANKYYPMAGHDQFVRQPLGQGLEAIRGYYSSVRTSVGRMLLNVNVATAAFYRQGPLLELLRELTPAGQAPHAQSRVNGFLKGLRFSTNYLPVRKSVRCCEAEKQKKVHVILELAGSAKTLKFTRGKTSVSIQQYFKDQYQIILKHPDAPCVNYGGPKDPKYVPAELCTIVPGQMAKRMLQGDQTRQMILFAARRPYENAESIVNDGLRVAKIMPESVQVAKLRKFGLKVDPGLLTVHGRILSAPTLRYGGTNSCSPYNGSWNLRPNTQGQTLFRLVKPLMSFQCLHVVWQGGAIPNIEQHLNTFRATLASHGLNPGPTPKPVRWEVPRQVVTAAGGTAKIKEHLPGFLKKCYQAKPRFLLVIVPGDVAPLYDAVKTVCDLEIGIHSVCSVVNKFTKETQGQSQYFGNIALKFNQKLGGINHVLQEADLKPLDSKTIVFGIDVTHPSPGSSESSPSIAGVVASVDANFSQYPASIRTQTGREEMVQNLDHMIVERMRLWMKRNQGQLPTRVIVYRDGVSEGQYQSVLRDEYPGFVRAFEKLYGARGKHPNTTIIVVGKRHHTRFYPTGPDSSDNKGNCVAGTVVDRGVTGEKLYDFFLLAHQGLQGTSKPGHYVVIKDENRLGPDQVQSLTHNLCYIFARATRSVGVCPPAYYADMLCERGRSYLHAVLKGDGEGYGTTHWKAGVHEALAESMFYL
ncbi:Piwi-domain-containing protein [Sporormia fimetaria CBS 119925]|uniref:Piwi-domain-containing protein n=1 Tax=Sporormia fimetaria CBS 119925 TaxID=1340428 RepID=A0A6A6V5Y0_9PLEO|nr:Piwi-domain-containing protein [Sporormia fimetaria CBS 119925]